MESKFNNTIAGPMGRHAPTKDNRLCVLHPTHINYICTDFFISLYMLKCVVSGSSNQTLPSDAVSNIDAWRVPAGHQAFPTASLPTEDDVLGESNPVSLSSSTLTLCGLSISAAAAEHLQQRPGVHPLLPGRHLHVQAHVPEDLGCAHLLACGLVVDGRARGVALGPRAAVHQVEGAAPGGRGPGSPAAVAPVAAVDVVALLQAPVPAVEGPGQGGALHSEVYPVAAEAVGGYRAVIQGFIKN